MTFTKFSRTAFFSAFLLLTLIGVFSRSSNSVYTPGSTGIPVISTAIDLQNSDSSVYTLGNTAAFPGNNAQSCAVICSDNGEFLYLKNADQPLPMASTTKIMTALVTMELLSPDTVVTVTPETCGTEGSSIYLAPGEKITVLDLLYGLMLESGNDAAETLAVAACGDIPSFTNEMNRKAKELGLVYTHFDNPHGLSSQNHKTTARELAIITCHAMQNPLFRLLVSTKNHTVTAPDGTPLKYFSNHNRMLRTYDGATGVKTGYTLASGRCLVSSARRNGTEFITVTLNDRTDFNDHKNLLDHAFSAYRTVRFSEKESLTFNFGEITLTNDTPLCILTETESENTSFSATVILRQNSP